MNQIARFRVDTLKLSTESMPIAEHDGTTCYEVDTGAFYIYYKGEWYEQGAEETPSSDDSGDDVDPSDNSGDDVDPSNDNEGDDTPPEVGENNEK